MLVSVDACMHGAAHVCCLCVVPDASAEFCMTSMVTHAALNRKETAGWAFMAVCVGGGVGMWRDVAVIDGRRVAV